MNKNLFIAFEGIDGSGKSTQAKLLTHKLEKEGHKVFLTCEPTNSSIGTIIRNMLTGKLNADQRTIAALFIADRLDHLLDKEEGILKKLEEGYTVITDRYYFSSFAYQGVHVPIDWVISSNKLSMDLRKPDINFFIDISPEAAMDRITKNRSSIELYETLETLKKVRENYFYAFDLMNENECIKIIDGNRSMEDISLQIYDCVKN